MQIEFVPVPPPVVSKPEEVYSAISEKILEQVAESDDNISSDGLSLTVDLDPGEESIFVEQDIFAKVDRLVATQYLDILDTVTNEMS